MPEEITLKMPKKTAMTIWDFLNTRIETAKGVIEWMKRILHSIDLEIDISHPKFRDPDVCKERIKSEEEVIVDLNKIRQQLIVQIQFPLMKKRGLMKDA